MKKTNRISYFICLVYLVFAVVFLYQGIKLLYSFQDIRTGILMTASGLCVLFGYFWWIYEAFSKQEDIDRYHMNLLKDVLISQACGIIAGVGFIVKYNYYKSIMNMMIYIGIYSVIVILITIFLGYLVKRKKTGKEIAFKERLEGLDAPMYEETIQMLETVLRMKKQRILYLGLLLDSCVLCLFLSYYRMSELFLVIGILSYTLFYDIRIERYLYHCLEMEGGDEVMAFYVHYYQMPFYSFDHLLIKTNYYYVYACISNKYYREAARLLEVIVESNRYKTIALCGTILCKQGMNEDISNSLCELKVCLEHHKGRNSRNLKNFYEIFVSLETHQYEAVLNLLDKCQPSTPFESRIAIIIRKQIEEG